MTHHRDLAYNQRHPGRLASVTQDGARPATPAGIGDLYYDDTVSPAIIYVAKPDLSGWDVAVTIGGASGNALDDLTDVTITTPSDGDILTYNSGTSQWESGAPTALTLDDLTDVAASGAANDQIIRFNIVDGEWQLADLPAGTLAALSDTNITTPATGQALTYNGASWVATTLSLDSLNGVNTSGVTSGDALTYNGSSWVPQAIPSPTVAMDDLSDANTSAAVNGQFLRYFSGAWENYTANLNALNDVNSPSPLTGNFLKFDGTNWIDFIFNAAEVPYTPTTPGDWSPAPTTAKGALDQIGSRLESLEAGGGGSATLLGGLSDVTITTPTDGQSLIYDSASGDWINGTGSGGGGGSSAYTPSDSSDWNSPAPGTVPDALDDLASDLKSFYFFANKTTGASLTESVVATLSVASGDVVTNKNGMWASGDPTWFIAPEEGFYHWTFNYVLDIGTFAVGYYEVYAEFWDGASSTEIGRLTVQLPGEHDKSGGSLSVGYYRPAGGSTMFVEFKAVHELGGITPALTYQISAFRVRL